LTVEEYNGSTYILQINENLPSSLNFNILELFGTNQPIFIINAVNEFFNLTYLIQEEINFFEYEIISGEIYQKDFLYTGIVQFPIFTTVEPNNITVTGYGKHLLTFSVTDDVNLGTGFSSSNFYVEITDDFCVDIVPNTDTFTDSYSNPNEYEGVVLIIDQFIWLMRYPARFLRQFNLYTDALAASLLAMLLLLFVVFMKVRNLKETVFVLFGISAFLFVFDVIYLDLFVIVSFIFSYFAGHEFMKQHDVESIQIKQFLFTYVIFYLIMFITGLTSISNISIFAADSLSGTNFFSVQGVITLITGMINIVVSFLLFIVLPIETNVISTLFINVINIIIIGFKLVVFVEIIMYIKRIIETLPFFG
jgi:hypothetical protein